MDHPAKRQRLEYILIRLLDKFTRNEVNMICPMIKAENSVRVLYKLQEEKLQEVLRKAGKDNGFKFEKVHWKTAPGSKEMEGILFIEYTPSQETDGNNCERLRKTLESKLQAALNGRYTVIDKVDDMTQKVPQPIISEFDFELHKLKVCSNEIKARRRSDIADECTVAETTEQVLEELKESYTKFAVLSQNGKGKSFILNLLLLMTADSQEEYLKNNKNMKLPEGFPNYVQWKNHAEPISPRFPNAIKDFFKDKNDNTPPPVCYHLTWTKDTKESVKNFSRIGEYFSKSSKLYLDPYVLAQKDVIGAHESTTKCILQLRYGTCYQLKVEYFNKEELQQQLYELFTKDTDSSQVNNEVKDKAERCLKARYKILIGHKFNQEEDVRTYEDIKLSKEVLEFAGKTELYIGRGKDSIYDRLALQDILRELTTAQEEDADKAKATKMKIAAVKKILVYLPSKILYGGKEILEMPGTDDSDPIAMFSIRNVLSEVDAVILVTEYGFKICEKEVKEMLSESGFVQRLRTDPSSNKLMLIAYPEKDSQWQFSCEEKDKIERTVKASKNKRDCELNAISKILDQPAIDNGEIFTSYLLPVLHSSILSQTDPKPEYEVIAKHADFLKHTGIIDLLIHLDRWALSKQKSSFEQVKSQAENFERIIMNPVMTNEYARAILQQLTSKEFLKQLADQNQRFHKELNTFKGNLLKHADKVVKYTLMTHIPGAKQKWDEKKDAVISIAVYNPNYIGKNPKYKVRLFNIIFGGFEEKIIYVKILGWINDCFEEYKELVIGFYSKELNDFLNPMKLSIPLGFVKEVVNEKLTSAKLRYIGNVRRPFNEKTLGKLMLESQKLSLKSVILEKNYKLHSLEEAKEQTEASIEECVMEVKDHFMKKLLDLHEHRFRIFQNFLWSKGCSKIWKELEMKIKRISRDRTEDNLAELMIKLKELLAANFKLQTEEQEAA